MARVAELPSALQGGGLGSGQYRLKLHGKAGSATQCLPRRSQAGFVPTAIFLERWGRKGPAPPTEPIE